MGVGVREGKEEKEREAGRKQFRRDEMLHLQIILAAVPCDEDGAGAVGHMAVGESTRESPTKLTALRDGFAGSGSGLSLERWTQRLPAGELTCTSWQYHQPESGTCMSTKFI